MFRSFLYSENPVLIWLGLLSAAVALTQLGVAVLVSGRHLTAPSPKPTGLKLVWIDFRYLFAFLTVVLTVLVLAGLFPPDLPPARRSTSPIPVVPIEFTRAQFNAAFRLASEGHCQDALALFRIVESTSPNFPTLSFQMAACERLVGALPNALAHAAKAVDESAAAGGRQGHLQIGDAEYNLAAISYASGQKDAAKAMLLSAVRHGFPYSCNVEGDPDLKLMQAEPTLNSEIRAVIAGGTQECSAGDQQDQEGNV